MRIRYQILHFLHEKVFGHDPGRERNKFTNLIYAILMPFCYLSERNTLLRYDWNRDVFIIDGMEFTHEFLKMVHRQRSEEFVGLNFEHLNLVPGGRPYGKQYNAFLRCVIQIEAGRNVVFAGRKWMMISTDSYYKLINSVEGWKGRIKFDEFKNLDEKGFFNNQKKEETMKSNIGIARVCHEANRQYCIDNKLPVGPVWDEAPGNIQHSVIAGVAQVIINPKVTATKMHENWMEYKASEGWKLGELDVEKKLHPNLMAFNKLPKVERAKDMLFIKTIKAELKK